MGMPKIEGLSDDQVLTLTRARSFEQYKVMLESLKAGKCVFCSPLGPKNIVFYEANGWRAWENPFKEPKTKLHIVLAPIRHISTEESPDREDFFAMGLIFEQVKLHYADAMKGGGFLMRFGSPKLNAGTILHLHANIMVPDLTGEVRLPLAKEPASVERGIQRLWVFEKLRALPESVLTDEERALLE